MLKVRRNITEGRNVLHNLRFKQYVFLFAKKKRQEYSIEKEKL